MIVRTPIGALGFTATSDGRHLSATEVAFQPVELVPNVPPHMSIQSLIAVLVTLRPASEMSAVRVTCAWLSPQPTPGSPESGERLDAQSWRADNHVVFVGTEDLEALSSRLPDCELTIASYPVTYSAQGLEVRLPRVRSAASLHFTVAVNSWPEPVECSAWFAVDVDHSRVLAGAGR